MENATIQIPLTLALKLSDELFGLTNRLDHERNEIQCEFCRNWPQKRGGEIEHDADCLGVQLRNHLEKELAPHREQMETEKYERDQRLIRYKAEQIKKSFDFERFAKKLDMLIFRMDCVGAVWPSNSARSLREDFQKSQDAFCERIASQLDMFQTMRKMKTPAGQRDAIYAAELLLDLQECGCPLEFDLSEFEKSELAKQEDRE